MLFFDVLVPRGCLTEEERRRVGARLIAEVVSVDGGSPAAQATARAMRALSWAVVREADTWVVDDRPAEPGEPPRFLVRVTVTAGALSDDKRAHVVDRVTRVLAEVDGAPDRLFRRPDAWVHLVEVPDGGWGALGRPMGFGDIVDLIQATRTAAAA